MWSAIPANLIIIQIIHRAEPMQKLSKKSHLHFDERIQKALQRDVLIASLKQADTRLVPSSTCRMSTNAQMNGKRPVEEEYSAPDDGSACAASSGKRQKIIIKGSHNKDEAEPEDDVLTSILPLRLTALGGYLPLRDAGRFLLRVSKDMTASIFEDRVSADTLEAVRGSGESGTQDGDGTNDAEEAQALRLRQRKVRNQVWKTLCEIKWRKPKVLEHLASTLGGDGDEVDWERLCRKFLPQPAKPVLRASVEDYSFILSLFNCPEGDEDVAAPLSTYVLEGEKAANFLKTGRADTLKLDEPVKIGNYASKSDIFAPGNDPMAGIFSTFDAIRRSDRKVCKLNLQSDLEMFDPPAPKAENGEYEYYHSGTDTVNIGLLRTLLIDAEIIGDSIELQIDRNLLAKAADAGDGTVDYYITHVGFSAELLINDQDNFVAFSDYIANLREGVTLADFLQLIDHADWK